MPWRAMRTWVPGDMATAPLFNQQIRDNFDVLAKAATVAGAPRTGPTASANIFQANTTAGQDLLSSYTWTLPANTLAYPGEGVSMWVLGYSYLGGAGTRSLYLSVGSSALITIWSGTVASTYLVPIAVKFCRRGGATGFVQALGGTFAAPYLNASAIACDWSVNQDIKLYAQFSGGTPSTMGVLDLSTAYILTYNGAVAP